MLAVGEHRRGGAALGAEPQPAGKIDVHAAVQFAVRAFQNGAHIPDRAEFAPLARRDPRARKREHLQEFLFVHCPFPLL